MIDWLMQPDVMAALGFYGGGLATVIGGLWVVYRYFTAKPPPADKSAPVAQAKQGIAAGGNVSVGGDVTIAAVPMAAWIVLGLGIAGLTAATLFGGGDTTITNGAQVGGDMEGSSIEIGE